jgi:hypothetical protein
VNNINNMRSCKVRRATDQTAIVTATATAVSFSTSVFNPNSLAEFTTNPTRITVDKAGLYDVSGGVVWAAGSTGIRTLQVKVNGTSGKFPLQCNQAAPASGTGIQSISGHVYLENGDYIELIVTHTQGSDLALTADTTAYSPFLALSLAHQIYDATANSENV